MTKPFIVTSYAQLDEYCRAWVNGNVKELIILGESGLGKTRAIKNACGKKQPVVLEGRNSPLEVYMDLYWHRHRRIVLDDTDGLFNTREGRALLRCLTDRDPLKHMTWNTSSAYLRKCGVPQAFTTTSRVVIITNEWSNNSMLKAISSRATLIQFQPSSEELLKYANSWFKDEEILRFAEQHQDRWHSPDLRVLERAKEIKDSGMIHTSWKAYFLGQCGRPDKLGGAAEVLADPTLRTVRDEEKAFKDRGYGSRATFYRRKRELARRAASPSSSSVKPAGSTEVPEISSSDVARLLSPILNTVTSVSGVDLEVSP